MRTSATYGNTFNLVNCEGDSCSVLVLHLKHFVEAQCVKETAVASAKRILALSWKARY